MTRSQAEQTRRYGFLALPARVPVARGHPGDPQSHPAGFWGLPGPSRNTPGPTKNQTNKLMNQKESIEQSSNDVRAADTAGRPLRPALAHKTQGGIDKKISIQMAPGIELLSSCIGLFRYRWSKCDTAGSVLPVVISFADSRAQVMGLPEGRGRSDPQNRVLRKTYRWAGWLHGAL